MPQHFPYPVLFIPLQLISFATLSISPLSKAYGAETRSRSIEKFTFKCVINTVVKSSSNGLSMGLTEFWDLHDYCQVQMKQTRQQMKWWRCVHLPCDGFRVFSNQSSKEGGYSRTFVHPTGIHLSHRSQFRLFILWRLIQYTFLLNDILAFRVYIFEIYQISLPTCRLGAVVNVLKTCLTKHLRNVSNYPEDEVRIPWTCIFPYREENEKGFTVRANALTAPGCTPRSHERKSTSQDSLVGSAQLLRRERSV